MCVRQRDYFDLCNCNVFCGYRSGFKRKRRTTCGRAVWCDVHLRRHTLCTKCVLTDYELRYKNRAQFIPDRTETSRPATHTHQHIHCGFLFPQCDASSCCARTFSFSFNAKIFSAIACIECATRVIFRCCCCG